VHVPISGTIKATVQGREAKPVHCEQCGFDYVYVMERSAQGHGTSFLCLDDTGARQRALAAAQSRVDWSLRWDCDPVPCPACGHYQRHMVPAAARLRYRWMGKLALWLFLLGCLLVLPGLWMYGLGVQGDDAFQAAVGRWILAAAGTAALAGPVLVGTNALRCRAYDPNSEDVARRIAAGRERAWSQEEFLKMVAGSKGP
jgi:hypothetical protein